MSFATSSSATSPPHVGTAPASVPKRAKSPPMAFERTSNDALAPRISPPFQNIDPFTSTSSRVMSPNGSAFTGSPDLQALVHKQANAISQLHLAFAAERDSWSYERENLYQRISSLEKLLNTNSGHSPAKSPTMSPNNGSISLASPPASRLANASILPSIAEDENVEPRFTLAQRREGAPSAIEIPIIDTVASSLNLKQRTNSVVSFADDNLKVEEIPSHSPWSAASPIPSEYKVHAGHTPVKTPARPLTPSLNVEDTPTRSNTQINASLARSDDEDEDPALTGPLSMPELPNQPGEHNFTEEALFRRLEHIAQSPGTEEARPLVFATRTPGLASPEELDGSPGAINSNPGGIVPPVPTHELPTQPGSTMSPQSGLALSQIASNEEIEAAVQKNFDEGGIKLKKKASSNFGAPWGTLGGFGVPRRPS